MASFGVALAIFGFLQLAASASLEDKYEPMVAFICERPAMHRTVNSWVPDRKVDCLEAMEDILAYCQQMYPDHNVSNVVEASYLVTIPDWPMMNTDRALPHRVRPFRCLSGGFQSDALLVPQHCEFDHRHDQTKCEGFSHWNMVADDACREKGNRLESFGMLLNCKLGHFSGVEYVCCPKDDSEYTMTSFTLCLSFSSLDSLFYVSEYTMTSLTFFILSFLS
ncbi:beta-amyloid protein [Elysia marginata]|uniref:Beta-amyloid protein n=1 Tax=Elysia marginata TaxID=1093978 RepID=A0AAV4G9C8_9GAST|nr:beta-amyloid protein [Elysia marginata]